MLGFKTLSSQRNVGLQYRKPSLKSGLSLVFKWECLHWLLGEHDWEGWVVDEARASSNAKFKASRGLQMLISQHLQFEAKKVVGKQGFWYPS